MDRGNSFSILMIFLAIIALFMAGSAEARFRGINPYCKTADYKLLCNAMVRGSTSLEQATENAIKSTLNIAVHLNAMMSAIKPAIAFLEPVTRDSIITTCQSNFEDMVDELTGALEDLKAKDMGSLMTKLSACTMSDCTESFEEYDTVFPLTKTTNALRRYLSNTAAVAQQHIA